MKAGISASFLGVDRAFLPGARLAVNRQSSSKSILYPLGSDCIAAPMNGAWDAPKTESLNFEPYVFDMVLPSPENFDINKKITSARDLNRRIGFHTQQKSFYIQ